MTTVATYFAIFNSFILLSGRNNSSMFIEILMQIFPWGGKITFESLRFFSPVVIWSKFTPSLDKHERLYSAFVEYLKVSYVTLP